MYDGKFCLFFFILFVFCFLFFFCAFPHRQAFILDDHHSFDMGILGGRGLGISGGGVGSGGGIFGGGGGGGGGVGVWGGAVRGVLLRDGFFGVIWTGPGLGFPFSGPPRPPPGAP